jgi:hypothetical protein
MHSRCDYRSIGMSTLIGPDPLARKRAGGLDLIHEYGSGATVSDLGHYSRFFPFGGGRQLWCRPGARTERPSLLLGGQNTLVGGYWVPYLLYYHTNEFLSIKNRRICELL